jgi:hypothetical protein
MKKNEGRYEERWTGGRIQRKKRLLKQFLSTDDIVQWCRLVVSTAAA